MKFTPELLVVVKNDVAIIMPKPESYRAALSGMGKGIYPKAHLRKERRSW